MELKNIEPQSSRRAFDALHNERNVTRAAAGALLSLQPAAEAPPWRAAAGSLRRSASARAPEVGKRLDRIRLLGTSDLVRMPVREALLLVQSTFSMYRQFDP